MPASNEAVVDDERGPAVETANENGRDASAVPASSEAAGVAPGETSDGDEATGDTGTASVGGSLGWVFEFRSLGFGLWVVFGFLSCGFGLGLWVWA